MDNSSKTINDLLERGIAECEIKANLQQRLKNGEKLRVKLGIDPTGNALHLGHTVCLRKLADFQKAGHTAILLIGNFTAKIGDPTGKDKTRPPLNDQEIHNNAKGYLKQASKIIDTKKNFELVYNADWLSKLSFEDVLQLAGSFTVQQMINRKSFAERINKGLEISLHEFLYPLMQGYDSVPIKADIELGATEQLFNLMAGRQIQKYFGQKPQDIMTMPILIGTDGKDKMSKSLNNYIGIEDDPREMFGKTMSIPDNLIANWFELLTDLSIEKIHSLIKEEHPRDVKLHLAFEIVKTFHTEELALNAKQEFLRMFQNKGMPDDIEVITIIKGQYSILDLIIKSNLCVSNSEAKRMITQGAVKVDQNVINLLDSLIDINSSEIIIQVGKRKFIKFIGN